MCGKGMRFRSSKASSKERCKVMFCRQPPLNPTCLIPRAAARWAAASASPKAKDAWKRRAMTGTGVPASLSAHNAANRLRLSNRNGSGLHADKTGAGEVEAEEAKKGEA